MTRKVTTELTTDDAPTLAQLVRQRMTYLGLNDRGVEARTEGAVSKTTVNQIRNGRRVRITEQTLGALAVVLGVPENVLRRLSEVVPGTPYVPPPESAYLTEAQRKAVSIMIRTLVER